MLLSVKYLRTDIKTEQYYYSHRLTDKDYIKDFCIAASTTLSVVDQQIAIVQGTLEFIYDNYRGTRECPFRNIKNLYDKGGIKYDDNVVRYTTFYSNHSKVMDKILRPIAIAPIDKFLNFSMGAGLTNYANYEYTAYTTAAATTTTTANVTYNNTANTYTATINLRFPTPAQYVAFGR